MAEKLNDDEIEELADECEGILAEIIIDNRDIADKVLPKLRSALTIFASACENTRLRKNE